MDEMNGENIKLMKWGNAGKRGETVDKRRKSAGKAGESAGKLVNFAGKPVQSAGNSLHHPLAKSSVKKM
ncbi:hypothetical protein [Neobacillus muris]|uniref:hypothetical protein n=1 Tax=Neobacillus muris TaxID=2941334 RepID=UPI00203E8EBD|nr:hypothetical protein [Neobacillus muris]